jgi:hypothetical protein
MLKICVLSACLCIGSVALKAQTTAGASSDTTHRHFAHKDGQFKRGPGGQNWGGPGAQGGRQWAGRGGWGGPEARRGGGRGGWGHRGHGFGDMAHVRYTPDQRKQIQGIDADYRKKREDLYKQDNLTLGAYKSQLVALDKDRKSKMQGLLTDDQKKQIVASKQRASDNAQVMAAARLERMKINLQLTDDQASKIKSQGEAFRAQAQAIRDNDNLLPDQKREQMKALFDKQKADFASVLTPDQQAKLKDMHSHFGGRRGPGGPGSRMGGGPGAGGPSDGADGGPGAGGPGAGGPAQQDVN